MNRPALTQEQTEARAREIASQEADREMTTVSVAAGAAAKAMQNAGWSRAQMHELMDRAWEIMERE